MVDTVQLVGADFSFSVTAGAGGSRCTGGRGNGGAGGG